MPYKDPEKRREAARRYDAKWREKDLDRTNALARERGARFRANHKPKDGQS